MRLRVATWNLHGCVGRDGRMDPARIGEVLAGLDADLIGLQEIVSRGEDPAEDDQLEALEEALALPGLAGPNLVDHRGHYGNALLYRLRLLEDAKIDLAFEGREPRGAIEARFAVGAREEGRSVRVVVTHLGLARAERAAQVATLRKRVAAAPAEEPTLLLADLNEWRPRPVAGAGLWPVPFPVASRPRTFPSRWPLLRLDRVLARPRPARFEARTVATPLARLASDHLPLVVDVEWG